jgi:hypothetical protein
VLPVKAARCLSLEILRGRGYKGAEAALGTPLAGTAAAAGDGDEVGCWRPCWCGRWWHAVRRRPHWLHRARGSSTPLSIRPFAPCALWLLWLWPWVLPTVASRLALTMCVVEVFVVVVVVVVVEEVPPMTTSIAAAAAAADAAAAAADLVETATAAPVAVPVMLCRCP